VLSGNEQAAARTLLDAGAWPLWPVPVAHTVLTLPWLWRTAAFIDAAL